MLSIREWFWRAAGTLRRRKLERQTESEMRFHLDMEIEAGLRRGLTRPEAERAARLHAGSITTAMEEVRDERGLGWMDGTWIDLRHAWLALWRRPGYLMIAGGALAFAVAINTLIFTVVDGVLLRGLPYPDADRLVRIYESTERNPKFPVSVLNYLEDKRANRTLNGIALYTRDDLQFMHGERAERLATVRISDDFLPTLGVSPALGRNFLPSEMTRASRVVMLSHTLWRTRFNGDREILGKTLRLNREEWTVVGVLPPGFQHVGGNYRSPLQGDTVALWAPLGLDLQPGPQRSWHFTNAIARMKPGVPLKAVDEDLNRIMDDLARQFPDNYGGARARVELLSDEVVGRSRTTVQIVMAAGMLVLLVACVNVAGLSVARALARRRELAIRQALGGSAWRLVRGILSENIVIGMWGAAAGLILAAALLPLLRLIMPADFPRLHEIGLSAAAAAFAVAIALVSSCVAGLIPAIRQIGIDPRGGLAEDTRVATASHRIASVRGVLVSAEIALACLLCFGAILLLRSSNLLGARDHGFDPQGVLTFEMTLPRVNGPDAADRYASFYRDIVRKWSEIPGVQSAGLATNLPWTGYDENTSFTIIGRPARAGESIQARFQAADAGYFQSLRFRLLEGRFIEPADHAKAPQVVVVNEAFARRYFPEGSAVGRHLTIWGPKEVRIVGVAADIRDQPADPAAEPAFWWPLEQQPFGSIRAVLRTDRDPLTLAPAARSALASMDREMAMAEVRTMSEIAGQALAERRFALWLCEGFAVLALGLAAIGLYGILLHLVQQRRREIGIRMALGASRSDVLWMVVANGLTLALFGVVAGLMLAPLGGRALSSMLFGIEATDALTFTAAPLVILVAAVLGSLAPAWMAARSEPVAALREQ